MRPADAVRLALFVAALSMQCYTVVANSGAFSIYKFGVVVHPRTEDCYFITNRPGQTLHFSFRVIKGGDKTIPVYIRDLVYDQVVRATDGPVKRWTTNVTVSHDVTYKICMDNRESLMTGKLVSVFAAKTYPEDLEKYLGELGDLVSTTTNMKSLFDNVDKAVTTTVMFQTDRKSYLISDSKALIRNYKYVMIWSFLQCLAIIASSGLQVYFVRRLFYTPKVTPTKKPRA